MNAPLKEWLNQTIVELEEERDATPGAVNEDATMALAAMKLALASLEAEPVFEVEVSGNHWLNAGPVDDSDFSGMPDGVNQLYTASPAPMLPEEMPKGLAGQIVSLLAHNIGDKFLAQKIWNACRAAMLQGAENAESRCTIQTAPVLDSSPKNAEPRCGNSPVIPDGWVACSKRLPDDEQEVITHNIFGCRHVSFFDEHSGHFFDRLDGNQKDCVEHVLVSHWMLLPATPQ
ncbi:DUF551 domain-containing protein [Enterobacter hormaechei]|uniref:DUF551 domain-containing protein n=1 Tax=Enterobacter hormaechei TaxID=158836 RepID=UPI0009B447F8|nr:DUF551 domain-containing protein [Enterobacter hormaechei]